MKQGNTVVYSQSRHKEFWSFTLSLGEYATLDTAHALRQISLLNYNCTKLSYQTNWDQRVLRNPTPSPIPRECPCIFMKLKKLY